MITHPSRALRFVATAALLLAWGCDEEGAAGPEARIQCSIDMSELFDEGIPKDAIPALTDPVFVEPDAPGADYADDADRVAGIVLDGRPLALPYKVLNWHEVVNFNVGGRHLALTYCPLTGSTLAFRRDAIDGGEFGVTGFLFRSNLVMFDRTDRESLWPQMARGAVCGPRDGTELSMVPVSDMPLGSWKEIHPDTRVLSSETGFSRRYEVDAFRSYRTDNDSFGLGFRNPDRRREPKELVMGVPDGRGGGVAFPFQALDSVGPVVAVNTEVAGRRIVVLWDRSLASAEAYEADVGGRSLTFSVEGGAVVDAETGSRWDFTGRAVAGELAESRLRELDDAYVAFWFAWAEFQPDTEIWTGDSGT